VGTGEIRGRLVECGSGWRRVVVFGGSGRGGGEGEWGGVGGVGGGESAKGVARGQLRQGGGGAGLVRYKCGVFWCGGEGMGWGGRMSKGGGVLGGCVCGWWGGARGGVDQ